MDSKGTDSKGKHGRQQDVDKGYAFVMLLACTISYMLVIGHVMSFGILFTAMEEYFQKGYALIGWVGSIAMFFLDFLGAFSNAMCRKYSFRRVMFIGGILIGSGFILTSFVPSVEYWFLTYGLITGFGFGLIQVPSMTLVSYYFVKHRNIANAVCLASSGVWVIVTSFLYEYLLREYGLRGTFLIIGGIMLNISSMACLIEQPQDLKELEKETNSEDSPTQLNNTISPDIEETRENNVTSCSEIRLHLSLFKMPKFVVYFVVFLLMMFGGANIIILVAAQMQFLGKDKIDESINVSLTGACDIVGKIFFGWLTEKYSLKTKYVWIMNLAIAGVFQFLATRIRSTIFMRIYSVVCALCSYSLFGLVPAYLIEGFGMEIFPRVIGVCFMSMSLMSLTHQPIIGWTADETGDWNAAFILTGTLLLMGSVLQLLETFVQKARQKKYSFKHPNKKVKIEIIS